MAFTIKQFALTLYTQRRNGQNGRFTKYNVILYQPYQKIILQNRSFKKCKDRKQRKNSEMYTKDRSW